ncbi:MAG: DNA repair exonuclease SbcCD nuclease subunit [Yoonia sp.]|jgi:DNA repair exonuclease SbcCD nuclease subunit
MLMRFFHTADLHLAKPFGRFDEDTRAALRAARLDAVRKIGVAARVHNAEFVLIAGDTFDAEAPPAKVVRRALDVMGEFADLLWVLLPGNHDSLAAVDLWERIARDKPDNVILAVTPEIIEIGDQVAILPAPPTVRNPGVDLTDWMTDAQTGSRFRIGLAHGGILDFGSEEGTVAVIQPDRAERSNLDYLALGDWHGQKSITSRTWYSGSPETDSFKGHSQAGTLLVEITAPGETPQVTSVSIGQFDWQPLALDVFSGTDPVQQLIGALPDLDRDKTLVRVEVSGRLGLLEQSQLRETCQQIADDFHFFEVILDRLGIEQAVDDLDLIATGGALRAAADSLLVATDLQGRTAEDVQIAQIALTHLFHIAQQEPTQ